MYQDLKDIESQTPAAKFGGNQYNREGTNINVNIGINMGINANAKMVNRSKHLVNFLYSRPSFVVLNPAVTMHPTRSKATKLIKKKIAKLQREN